MGTRARKVNYADRSDSSLNPELDSSAYEAASNISRGNEQSLFSVIMKSGTSNKVNIMELTTIADKWASGYDYQRSDGLQRIIQLIINSSGCKGIADKSLYESDTSGEGFQTLINRMIEQFDEDSTDYPFIQTTPIYKRFRNSVCEFFSIFIKQCQRDIIYDAFLMDNVIQLLTEMSGSTVRAFRHTASILSMKIMTSLVKIALKLHQDLNQNTRQLDIENSKPVRSRATNKINALNARRKELEDQSSEIEDMLNSIFKGIFAHRYRDMVPDIRACCMEEIGNWMRVFPKVFLTDSYLKYVGWTLNDKIKEVRIKCVNTLLSLYKDRELCKDLRLFTKRFKSRLSSMTADKEQEVAVLATKLCTCIVQNFPAEQFFSREECEIVYMLVFSQHRPLAAAAADFLWEKIFAVEDAKNAAKRGKNKPKNKNIPLLHTGSIVSNLFTK